MKLNRKGYLTVEIILASTIEIILGATIAFAIAFFLMEITIKMVNVTEDNYKDIVVITDNALVISNIKELLDNKKITNITCSSNICTITYDDIDNTTHTTHLSIDNRSVIYKENTNYLYVKELDKSLSNITLTSTIRGDITGENKNNIYFKITAQNIFIDKDYSIIIPIDIK